MRRAVLLVPGRLATRTGGYGYDRRIVGGLADLGWQVGVEELDASFPVPSKGALDDAARRLAGLPSGTTVVIDGLALGGMPDVVEREGGRLDLIALVHHPLAAETGLDTGLAARLEAGERRALAAVRRVIVTSPATALAVGAYGVPRDQVVVAQPGTDPAPLARGSGSSRLALLSVASLTPRKGFDVLFAALAPLLDLDWRLTVAGTLDRDPGTVRLLSAMVRELALAGRVQFVGEADEGELAVLYDRADVFVLATRHEGYGMVVGEALARGIPVVSTATGGIPDLLAGGGGLLVSPGDVEGLSQSLRSVISDAALRRRLADGARRTREHLPTWTATVARVAAALERV